MAQAELMSAGGTRRTYLKAGALFFARAPQVTKQAVAGMSSRTVAAVQAVAAVAVAWHACAGSHLISRVVKCVQATCRR